MAVWKGIQAMNKTIQRLLEFSVFTCNFKHVIVWAMLTLQYTAGGK